MKTSKLANKRVALIFGITEKWAFALGNTLMGFKEHSPELLKNVFIYHDGLMESTQKALSKITPCKFILYKNNELETIQNSSFAHYSILMFARYEGFKLLKDYDIFVWSDVDVLVQNDISDMVRSAAAQGLGMCPAYRHKFLARDCFKKPVPDYDMEATLYNSGLLVVSKELPQLDEIYDWLYSATIKYAEYLEWPDQGILNLLLQEFKIFPYDIDIEKYQCSPWDFLNNAIHNEKKERPAIVHAYGPQKFWDCPAYFMAFEEWRRYNHNWAKSLAEESSGEHRTPEVSIVMPTMNAEQHLKDAVISILDQSFSNFELLVVDGGSKDKTLSILNSIKDPRLIVIQDDTPNGNISTSLNLGLAHARGTYIARMDADDVALPVRLQYQVDFLHKNPTVSLCATGVCTFGSSYCKFWPVTDPEMVACQLLFATPIVHPSVMWRRADFEKFNLRYDPTARANEDLELWQRASQSLKLSAIPATLLMYRQHTEKASIGAPTRDAQLKLMDRAMSRFGIRLSHNALLLIDQRDNTFNMSDAAVERAFCEFCAAARKIIRKPENLQPKKFAQVLLSMIRWIFYSRVEPRYCGATAYIWTIFSITKSAGMWKDVFFNKFCKIEAKAVIKKIRKKKILQRIFRKFFHMLLMRPKSAFRYGFSLSLRAPKEVKRKLFTTNSTTLAVDHSWLLEQVIEKSALSEIKATIPEAKRKKGTLQYPGAAKKRNAGQCRGSITQDIEGDADATSRRGYSTDKATRPKALFTAKRICNVPTNAPLQSLAITTESAVALESETLSSPMTNRMLQSLEKYKQSSPYTKLHLGCGANYLDGWFNTDIAPNEEKGIFYQDLLKEFPFENHSVDYIFMEHAIEHFTLKQATFMFKEFARILKPNGVLRLATPDLRKMIDFYLTDNDLHSRYNEFQIASCLSREENDFKPAADFQLANKSFVLNNFFRDWGHMNIYDFASLEALLRASGFDSVVSEVVGKSRDLNLCSIEKHGGENAVLSKEFNELETMVVEARIKPQQATKSFSTPVASVASFK